MPEAGNHTIAWKFDVARNAMGGETLTAYVNRTDKEQAWRILRAKLPHADLFREVAMSAQDMALDNQSPFQPNEELRFAREA